MQVLNASALAEDGGQVLKMGSEPYERLRDVRCGAYLAI
jgi:hypothetical protein